MKAAISCIQAAPKGDQGTEFTLLELPDVMSRAGETALVALISQNDVNRLKELAPGAESLEVQKKSDKPLARQLKGLGRTKARFVLVHYPGEKRRSLKKVLNTFLTKGTQVQTTVFLAVAPSLFDRLAEQAPRRSAPGRHCFALQEITVPAETEREFVGSSADIQLARKQIVQAARMPGERVLILGATGTGKDHAARLIHDRELAEQYPDGRAPASWRFLAVDVTALVDTLVLAELFGCVKGAFTGATADRPGLVHSCRTILLNEFADAPAAHLDKLRCLLETGEFRRVGSTKVERFSGRIIVATNRNLDTMRERGELKADVYQRLHLGIVINLPPLRQRRGDIPALALQLWRRNAGCQEGALHEQVIQDLQAYEWPNNVRQLWVVLHKVWLDRGNAARPEDFRRQLAGQPKPCDGEKPAFLTLDSVESCRRACWRLLQKLSDVVGQCVVMSVESRLGGCEPGASYALRSRVLRMQQELKDALREGLLFPSAEVYEDCCGLLRGLQELDSFLLSPSTGNGAAILANLKGFGQQMVARLIQARATLLREQELPGTPLPELKVPA